MPRTVKSDRPISSSVPHSSNRRREFSRHQISHIPYRLIAKSSWSVDTFDGDGCQRRAVIQINVRHVVVHFVALDHSPASALRRVHLVVAIPGPFHGRHAFPRGETAVHVPADVAELELAPASVVELEKASSSSSIF